MFFIIRGTVQILGLDGVVVRELDVGDFFGEAALLTVKPRNATVLAKTYCQLMTLSKPNFKKIMRQFPAFAAGMQRYAPECGVLKGWQKLKYCLWMARSINRIGGEESLVSMMLIMNGLPSDTPMVDLIKSSTPESNQKAVESTLSKARSDQSIRQAGSGVQPQAEPRGSADSVTSQQTKRMEGDIVKSISMTRPPSFLSSNNSVGNRDVDVIQDQKTQRQNRMQPASLYSSCLSFFRADSSGHVRP